VYVNDAVVSIIAKQNVLNANSAALVPVSTAKKKKYWERTDAHRSKEF
jgi:hypothetical protein